MVARPRVGIRILFMHPRRIVISTGVGIHVPMVIPPSLIHLLPMVPPCGGVDVVVYVLVVGARGRIIGGPVGAVVGRAGSIAVVVAGSHFDWIFGVLWLWLF